MLYHLAETKHGNTIYQNVLLAVFVCMYLCLYICKILQDYKTEGTDDIQSLCPAPFKTNTCRTYPGTYTCNIQICRHNVRKPFQLSAFLQTNSKTGKTQVLVLLVNIRRALLGLEMTTLNIHVGTQGGHSFLISKRLCLVHGRKST